ncbi:MAG TPA: ion transporter [Solimonas sp.]|nr:ion transporter [Solimonas sp.]
MNPTPDAPPSLLRRLLRVSPLDWLMLALALISIGLLGYETWGPVSAEQRREILLADVVICGIFALEFLWRWRGSGWRSDFVWRNWYEILGMIPAAHPAIRGFRLFRVLRIVVLLARFGSAADRALGDDFTYLLVNRIKDRLVRTISGAVTVAVLDEVAEVLNKGTYTRNISRALQENERELRATILEQLRKDPQTGRLSRLPFYQDIVESVIDAGLRVVEGVLRDPRTDELVADMLRENITQLRQAVAAHEAERQQAAAAS